MVYNAKTERGLLGFFLLIAITSISVNDLSSGWVYFQIGLIILIILSIFIEFTFKMDDGFLVYQILFLTVPIYKKELSPRQIVQIKFKRFGWMTKGAMIQVKKGLNIRLIHFSSDNIFVDLIHFANKNSISIAKTKDYRILEK